MAAVHNSGIDGHSQLRVPTAPAAVRGPEGGAELLQVVHLLHELGVPDDRAAGWPGARSSAPI